MIYKPSFLNMRSPRVRNLPERDLRGMTRNAASFKTQKYLPVPEDFLVGSPAAGPEDPELETWQKPAPQAC
jgi:hypothetical protein